MMTVLKKMMIMMMMELVLVTTITHIMAVMYVSSVMRGNFKFGLMACYKHQGRSIKLISGALLYHEIVIGIVLTKYLKTFTRYSTVSKRVNVKNLKSDIWDWIDDRCPRLKDCDNSNQNSNTKNISPELKQKKRKSTENVQPASFQSMVSNVAKQTYQEKGQEVSVSYYFICLLHLANENSLHIESSSTLADLAISKE